MANNEQYVEIRIFRNNCNLESIIPNHRKKEEDSFSFIVYVPNKHRLTRFTIPATKLPCLQHNKKCICYEMAKLNFEKWK